MNENKNTNCSQIPTRGENQPPLCAPAPLQQSAYKTQKHEQKTCPHCNTNFECKSGDIVNCQCESVMLKQEHRDYISSQYDDCLCAHCMRIMRSEYNVEKFNSQMQQLTLGK
ncbi:MAG: hypothetical protein DIZ80_16660 [endosymbiont of Galathealinum brachiosum]|uniref:Cysteine-rich CWC family protein n=1 Tax=endosymbiont of Galathealinum brachiosum TaxID=2200906 RepID=A0A370D6J9_9GAMM|nr:MAG: hypothetical protein DIZ80_16660 [endosymbiont of Galathealinum brachiosum]